MQSQNTQVSGVEARRLLKPIAVTACLFVIAGCGSGGTATTSNPTDTQPVPRTYFAPYVYNTSNGGAGLLGPYLYQIDDVAHTFAMSTFRILSPQTGPQVIDAGTAPATQRGLLALTTVTNYVSVGSSFPTNPNFKPLSGGFAVEFANQAGGFAMLAGQPAAPLSAATQCPTSKTAQTYLFLTVPGPMVHAGTEAIKAPTWDPALSTAYGSVDIASDGTNVTFSNIQQHTLASGLPSVPAPASVTGLCGPTVLGNTTSVPGQLVTKNPGGSGSTNDPQASIGIGPTGLLVEDNGTISSSELNAGAYQNVLGAGSGAVGLPKPSAAVDTAALRSAQYLGFVTGAGTFVSFANSTGWSSHLASFGFSSTPSTCASVATNTGTMLYGGDFAKDDPTTSGLCDLAIDLGSQDSATNGLFSHATLRIGSAYANNLTGNAGSVSIPAVAIAGQLNNKYVILLIGADATQPWSVYLSQTN